MVPGSFYSLDAQCNEVSTKSPYIRVKLTECNGIKIIQYDSFCEKWGPSRAEGDSLANARTQVQTIMVSKDHPVR